VGRDRRALAKGVRPILPWSNRPMVGAMNTRPGLSPLGATSNNGRASNGGLWLF